MLWKIGAGISDLDELYGRKASYRLTLVVREQMPTPVPLSTTIGTEGSMILPEVQLYYRFESGDVRSD
jgi:hypothetical protein